MCLPQTQTNKSMTNIVTHDYNGFAICQREVNGYVSLTDMAKATGKQVHDYLRLDSTTEYLEAFSVDTGIPVSALVKVFKGGNTTQGTWAHPEIAMDFAKWCNVHFRVWANRTLVKVFNPNLDQDSTKAKLKAVNAEILQFKLAIAERKLASLQQKHQKAEPQPIRYDKTVAAWADEFLTYEVGSSLLVGVAHRRPDTLSTSYARYCESIGEKPLGQQRFSPALMLYLQKVKGWRDLWRNRESLGSKIHNINFVF